MKYRGLCKSNLQLSERQTFVMSLRITNDLSSKRALIDSMMECLSRTVAAPQFYYPILNMLTEFVVALISFSISIKILPSYSNSIHIQII